MYTNTSMTIYNKKYDKRQRLDTYKRTVIDKVFWDESKAYNRLQSGLENSDEVNIFIPFDAITDKEYIDPIEYKKLDNTEGYFTLSVGDRVVRGSIDLEINKPTDLDEHYEAFTITSVDDKRFGSTRMRHWQLGAK